MSENLIDLLETMADITIFTIFSWVAWLFWRAFAMMKSGRNLALAAAFGLVAIFKLIQVTTEAFLGIEGLEWMDSVLASEALIIFLGITVIVALSGGLHGRWAKRPEGRKPDRRDA